MNNLAKVFLWDIREKINIGYTILLLTGTVYVYRDVKINEKNLCKKSSVSLLELADDD